ncbi:MAG: TonB-dependent receptor [Acidobacteria bacterium]|nr:TonB-dependent receptor [Acidobacteriota bacterium]
MTRRACQTFLIAAFLLCGNLAHAQVARSQFNGTIKDSAGGVLVGASVTATNVETNVASTTTTTDAGVYVIPYLANGIYQVRVEAPGFRPSEANAVTLRAAQTLTLDFRLEVDAIAEALTVTAPVIETGTAEIGRYVSNKEYQTWPVPVSDGQRQIQQFVFSSLPGSTGNSFEGSINGGRNYSHEILIEGIPLGRNLQGGSNNEMSPPTEAVEEFKLQTGTLGAEYGGGQTAVANFVVKSGTNEFRGSGAIYVQDSAMDARPFVAKALGQNPPARELQNWALALGGPVMLPKLYNGKGRSFFFATYETTHAEEQTSTAFRTLPTREFQSGDFSRLFDPAYTGDARSGTIVGTDPLGRPIRFGQIYDPRSTRTVDGRLVREPFQNNVIPREVWDTVARNTIEMGLWDAPALARLLNNQPVLGNCCPIFDQKTFATKLDQVISSRHKASFYLNREWRTRNNSLGGRYGPPPGSPTNLYQLQETPSWMIRASENWVISDRLLHRFAFGYNRFENGNRSVFFNQGWPSRIGLENQPDTTFPRFAFGGTAILGNLGNFGSLNRGLSYEGSTIIQDDLTIVMGRHNLKTGFEGRFYFVDNENADGTATYNFNSAQTNLPGFDQTTGHAYASFLLGAVATSSRPVQAVNTDYFQRDFAFYVQDDFKVTSQLTLNLGLRWQIIPGMYEKNGYVTNADLTLPNELAGGRPGALRFASQEGRQTFIDTYYKQFQPRLGAAYAVSPRLAITGGYSSSNRPATAYSDNEGFGGLNSAGYNANIAVNRATRPTPNAQDPVMYLSDPYPSFAGTLPNYDPTQLNNQGVTVLTGEEARREQYHNFNLMLRHQLPAGFSMTAAFIGAQGRRLAFDSEINRIPFEAVSQYGDLLFSNLANQPLLGVNSPYPGFAGTLQQALRPYPQFTSVTFLNNFKGKTRYNSLQTTLERQFRDGIALLVAHTWSKTEDNVLRQDGSGDEWALAAGRHIPHFLKLTWIYELPIGPGKRVDVDGVIGQILGGWTLTGIHNYRSGGTLSVFDSRMNGAGYPLRPDLISGVDPIMYDGSAVDLTRGTPYLNPAAFATQPLSAQGVPSRLGTAPAVLPVRGPAVYSEDFGVLKRFSAGGRNLEFRADLINALNRSGLAGPITDISNPNFGRIFGVGSGPRRIQLSLRASF